MYMSGIKCCPRWASDLKVEILSKFKIDPSFVPITFYLPKAGKRKREVTGAHYAYEKGVELMVGNQENTILKRFILIHELGHALHYKRYGYPKRLNNGKSKRYDHHPDSFWRIVIPLYEEYGVLDIALREEYSKGKKLILKYLEEKQNGKR